MNVDLRTGAIRPPDPLDYMTKSTAVCAADPGTPRRSGRNSSVASPPAMSSCRTICSASPDTASTGGTDAARRRDGRGARSRPRQATARAASRTDAERRSIRPGGSAGAGAAPRRDDAGACASLARHSASRGGQPAGRSTRPAGGASRPSGHARPARADARCRHPEGILRRLLPDALLAAREAAGLSEGDRGESADPAAPTVRDRALARRARAGRMTTMHGTRARLA